MTKYTPTLFVAPFPDSETLGGVLAAWTQNLRAEDVKPILKKHGMETIEEDKWYNLQVLLDVVRDVVESKENVIEDLAAVAIKTVETSPLPPEISSIEAALAVIGQIVRTTNRHIPDDYGLPVEFVAPQHALVTNNIPFPPELLYGYLWGLAKRFKQPDHIFEVTTLPAEPGKPRVVSVRWGLPEDLEES